MRKNDMANYNLGLSVTAGLEKPKSVTQINNDILKIEGQLKKLKLQVKIDGKANAEIQKQISALNKQKRNLYVDLKLRQKDLKKQYKQAVAEINQKPIDITVNTKNAEKQLSGLNNSIQTTRSETVTLANTLTKALNNMGLVVSAQTALQLVRKAAQEATDAVKEYDKYATNLSMITGNSRESANEIIADLSEKSFDFKVDISDLEGAYETLLRTGKTAEELDDYLKSTVFLSKIGFENMDTSAENLVTIANAYKLQSNEIENVVSKLSALDTASMTVAGKLSTAMAKTGQNAQLAGLNIDKLGAIISGLRDTTGKSEDELATSLNGILTRLYNVKLGKYEIELEDGSTENITESLNNVERMLKTVGMDIRTSKGEFKDVSVIIDELVSNWDKLNDVQKNSVGFTFAGTHHKNTFIALVENWNRINELTEISANSAGQAQKKYDAYLQSIESKSAALSNAMKELWNNLIPNGFVGDITDATTGIVKFIDEYQVLQTAIKSATFYALAKGIISAKNGFAGMITDIKNVSYAMDLATKSSAMTKEQFASFSVALNSLSDKQIKLVLSNSNLTESEMIKALTIDGTTEAEARQKLATLGITQANQQATASTFSLNGSMKTLFATISANPVMVLTMAFTALVSIYQKVQREQEKARKTAVEMADKYDEQATALQNLRQEYINIVDSESDVSKKTEELNEWKKTLIETYGFEKEALENVNLEREKSLGLLDDEITKNRINSAETWLTENNDAYEKAKKKLTSRNNSTDAGVISRANIIENVTKDTLKEYSSNFDDIIKQLEIKDPTRDNPLAQIKVKGSNTLEQYKNLKQVLNDITSIKVTKGLNKAEEELYKSLLAKQKEYKKVVTDDIIDIYETGNKYTNMIKLVEFETADGIDFNNITQENYKAFRDQFLESLGYSYKKDSKDFSLDIEQTLLDMLPDFEKVYRGIQDNTTDIAQETNDEISNSAETASKSLEDLQKAYEQLSKSASDYTKNQKSITSALEEQEKYGQLSARTIQELTEAGYAKALVVDSETGAVTLNKQAYEQLNKEKKQAIILEAKQQKTDLEQKYQDEQSAISDLTLEMKYANEERRKAIALELAQHGQNMAGYADMIDKINSSTASLNAPTFEDGKKETPTEIQNFLDDYAKYRHDINMGIKKEDEDYFNWLDKTAHDAYSKYPDYLDDLWKYEEEVYKGRKQLAEDYFNEEQKLFENRVANLETQIEVTTKTSESSDGTKLNTKEKYDYIRSAYQEIIYEIESRINDIVQAGVEGHEEALKELEKQLDEYKEKLSDVFKSAVEEEQDYIEKLKKSYSDSYDENINKIKEQKEASEEAIQSEIDALKKVNEEKQRTNDLEKAKQKLENAKKQRTRAVFENGMLTYQVDQDKIDEAQEEYDEALLENQIAILEEQKEIQSNGYDALIENLENEQEAGERRFDVLLKVLDEYLNPDNTTSNADVWSKLAKMQGAKYENGTWYDKDGSVINIEELKKSSETKTEDEKKAGTDNAIENKIDSALQNMYAKWEKQFNLKAGSLTFEKTLHLLNPSINYDPYSAMKERINTAYNNEYVNNINNNNTASSVTIGDININNPVGNSNDLAQEFMKNLSNAVQRQLHTNR